jgi:cytoskeletal protein RodZ
MYSHQNLLNLGQALKERREDQGLSLEKISEWTKVSVSTLQAIEEARADQLPVYTYLRGFILAYAKVLGMDEQDINKELKDLLPQGEEIYLPGVASSSSEAENLIEKDLRLMPVILAISILFILGSILVFTNVIRSYKEPEALDMEKSIGEGEPEFSEDTEEMFTEEQETDLTEGEGEEQQNGGSDEHINSDNENKEDQNLSGKTDYALEIVVKALGEVRIFYQEDKGKKKEISLKEDQFKVLKGRENIFIGTDTSDKVYIFHNGENLGVFGSGGKKEQIFSKEDL